LKAAGVQILTTGCSPKASSQKQKVMNNKPRRAILGDSMKTPKGMIEKASSIQENLLQPQYNQVVPTPAEVMALINDVKPYQLQVDNRNYQYKPGRDERIPALKTALRLRSRPPCDSNAIA